MVSEQVTTPMQLPKNKATGSFRSVEGSLENKLNLQLEKAENKVKQKCYDVLWATLETAG